MFIGAERVKTTKVQTLKAEFETLSMKDTEIIDDFAIKVNNMVSNIQALGEKVEEAYVVKKLLRAVPTKFLQIASTIEQFADLDNMTVEEVIGRLKAHEERVHGQSESGERKLLLTHQEWLERSKKKGDEEQRTSQRNTRSSVSNNRGRGRGNYSNRGGRRSGGSNQNRDGGRGSTKRNHKANLTQKDDEPALLLCVRHEVNEEVFLNEKHVTPKLRNLNEESNTSKVWYLDNGASNHMTGDREKFSDINRSVQGTWRYYTDKWGTFVGSRQEWKTAHEGHVNFQKLKEMCDKNLVHGLKAIEKPDALCKGCLAGKQTRNPYPTQTLYKAKERLELIHADICGPISPQTPADNRYFFLLVDDFSLVIWVYMLKSKDEALGMFQKFCVLVENKTGVKVKTLRTDRGVEFNSKAFTKYCDDTGLKHHFTAPYSPQQNGVMERRNRSVIEMARSMMKSMEVLDTLWGEVVRQAVYIQNRVPTKTLGDTTPYEGWSGKKPNLEHLRVFGCVAHSKVLRGHQQKLNSRSEMLKWGETTKFKESPSSTFTIEGYSQEDTILENENDPTDEPQEIFEGINDEEFQPTPPTHIHGDEGLSTPTQSPVTYVGSTNEPTSYVMASKDREWVKAMKVELDAIEKNQTWSLVDLPVGRKPIGLKWVYKLKRDPSGNILKHKARLVAKGYVQKPGVDFDEVFAPVARIETIRILLALASSHGWKVHHLDVKSAFLNGWLEEEVYVTQPEGYMKANHPEKLYKLSKALYGLRQAPRAWNSRLDKCL
nr:retrovirus-related Pol polyprotein from transposon TNT 1-94 [Tanacetum cinerariifolium]